MWWTMRKLKMEESVIQVVKSMYNNAKSKVRGSINYSQSVNVTVGVHDGYLFLVICLLLSWKSCHLISESAVLGNCYMSMIWLL